MMNRDFLACVMWALLMLLIGLSFGHSCNKGSGAKSDTSIVTRIVERPVYIKDTIKVKSVQLKYKDYFHTDTLDIPCNDTNFIAQADSVITSTNDTINMAFNYTNRRGYFSLVYRPRPDSIQVQTITIPIEAKQNYGFLVGSFGLGLVLGVVSGAKR
jgi:hypothetical protein